MWVASSGRNTVLYMCTSCHRHIRGGFPRYVVQFLKCFTCFVSLLLSSRRYATTTIDNAAKTKGLKGRRFVVGVVLFLSIAVVRRVVASPPNPTTLTSCAVASWMEYFLVGLWGRSNRLFTVEFVRLLQKHKSFSPYDPSWLRLRSNINVVFSEEKVKESCKLSCVVQFDARLLPPSL